MAEQTKTKVEALFLVRPPFGSASQFHIETYSSALQFLETARTVPKWSEYGARLRVSSRKCSDKLRSTHFQDVTPLWDELDLLHFLGEFEYPGDDKFDLTKSDGSKVSPSVKLSFWNDILPERMNIAAQTYLCALQIAYPGALCCIGNVWLADATVVRHRRYLVSLVHEAIEFLVENGVTIPTTNPQRTIRWVFAQNGMFDGYSNTPASRALNYFSRLFVSEYRNDELSDLVWALGGIEALIVEGGRSSKGQLQEKLSALLDIRPDWLRYNVERMYSFRSAAVHGSRQLRSEFRSCEDDTKQRFDEEYDSALFAVAVLALLLQKVIERNVPQFSFRTVVDG